MKQAVWPLCHPLRGATGTTDQATRMRLYLRL
jgi:hypothetical protein